MSRITVRSLDPDSIMMLERLAEQHFRSRDGEIRAALEDWIASHTADANPHSALDRYRLEMGERIGTAIGQLQRVPDYSSWNPSVVAERMGEPDPDRVVAAAHGEATLSFEQLDTLASTLGLHGDWLKHGNGATYPVGYLRLQGNMVHLLQELLEPKGMSIQMLHLLRSRSECGELIIVQQLQGSPAARVFTTPHHISLQIGAGGEGDLVEVFDCLRRLYRQSSTSPLVLGYLTPEQEIHDFFEGHTHPLELVERSIRSIWWEDVWDKASLRRNTPCWPGQHELTTRILEASMSRAINRPYAWPGESLSRDEEAGRDWWDGLTRDDRRLWLERAGQWSQPVNAWRAFQGSDAGAARRSTSAQESEE